MIVWQAHKARLRQMAFSPDGAELATTAGSSKLVSLWRAATGEASGQFACEKPARAVAYSPDGILLAALANEAVARVWDRATGNVVGDFSGGWCAENIAFRPDSSAVAVGQGNGAGEWEIARFASKKRGLKSSNRFVEA